MCGIVGSINTSINLQNALQKIKHRGPNAQGVFENELIQFGHVRLSIIDLSVSANQPFENKSTGSVLVFNGEIYNFKELKESLKKDIQFFTESDTEVLFNGLQVEGINFIQKLQGMFAFAYFDGIQQKSYLVRDRYGIKPLYYKEEGAGLLFSSEIKAIRAHHFTVDEINQDCLADFIYNRRLDNTNHTFFKAIEQIPASSYLIFDHKNNKKEIINYYQFPCIGSGNSEYSVLELKNKIEQTVKIHLQADVPIGAFLSGGIDSSIISHAMASIVKDEVSTLSGRTVYDHPENKLIDIFLTDHPNIKSIQFQLDGAQFFEEIFNVIYHHDEPILDGSMFSHYMLCKEASANGLKVVLSGSGGDEVFGGYESHVIGILTDQLKSRDFIKFIRNFKTYTTFHSQKPFWVFGKVIAELLGQKCITRIKKIKGQKNLLTIQMHNQSISTVCQKNTGAAFERNLKYFTIPPYLHYEDRNSMAFGVEIRVPFLDHKLIEYVSKLKRDDLFDGTTKSTLRKSFANDVSTQIIYQRKKEGFPSPIDTALKKDEKLKSFFYANLSKTPFLNTQNCEKLAADFYQSGKNLTLFWRVLSYMIWYNIQIKENVC
jgi:asparagine synthase (glutamine-hydrolysing)